MWHGRTWLIDHGASLYVHHTWRDPDSHAEGPLERIRDHVLLPFAGGLAEASERLAPRLGSALFDELVAAGIPAGPINFPDEALADQQVHARRMIVELEHPLIGIVRSIAAPMRFAANGPTYRRYPPRLGEHNDEIRAGAATW